ncbi:MULTISPECIES: sugar ABC transporter ATPase [Microbacterium]|uniref:Sugar ABC transporter ATPase n=1 Tax=Microbacterium wangchenii TaxID=2541726 RepID=A0ABX5STM8_9MICO|nr:MULTISPECIES: sugar ABC transporter ATPase [Microbacterium]MCK6066904.1 sugar ABC transporter ATPase [Microbacterium sp. EYE_512]QBR88209.1 sugar ABC transporter ATPase [Microbacterium wangchenii]TFV83671.1 sugar ABC transporter ATPase [Microbacterium sp. dk485]TXK18001.1 sugar ABC transporter ATPase [Microbacterium wangchenii]
MSDTNRDSIAETEEAGIQPLRDGDTSIEPDPAADPAQAEWEETIALDEGASPEDLHPATATGDDPAQIPSDTDEIPAEDRVADWQQPETQGLDPEIADLGEEGEGDLAPEDY